MVSNRTSKMVFVVMGCMLALLIAVLPAMAWAPEDSAARPSSVRRSVDQSAPVAQVVVAPQQMAVPAPQAEAATAAAPATAAVAPIITVDAGPVARPAAPVAVAPAAEVAAAPAEAVAPAAAVEEAVVVIAPVVLPSSGGDTEFTGSVSSLTGVLPNLTLMVSGQTVKTNSQTEISGTLAVGVLVEVKGTAQPDSSILASRIRVQDAGGGTEVEFRGPIVTLPNDPNLNGNWTVGNVTVTVNLATTVFPTRTAAVLGAIAEVKALRQPDGSLLAQTIKIESEHEFENEVEFKGTISDLTGTGPYTMTVANHTVKTDALTQINITLTNGALVEVRGQLQSDGSVLANSIRVEDQTEPVEVEFTAHITGTLPAGLIGTWTFDNGKTVTVTTSTLIDQSHGAVVIGARVEVKALKQLDNSLLAVRIKVED